MSTTSPPVRSDVGRSLFKHIYAEHPPKLKDHKMGDLKPDKLKVTLTKVSECVTAFESELAGGSEAKRHLTGESEAKRHFTGGLEAKRCLRAGAVSPLFQPDM